MVEVNNKLTGSETNDDFDAKWEFDYEHLYKIALKFYKENESKAFHPSYDERNNLVAFIYQVKYGKYENEKAPQLGTLDIVGKDRRQAWITLGDISVDEAKRKFVELLDSLCPLFKPYVKALKCDYEEKERIKREQDELERRKQEELREKERLELEAKRKMEEEMKKFDEQKRAIQEALNKQTYQQFRAYAEQQFPGNIEQQNVLITQLQEQHYQQYMQQMLQHQLQRTHITQQQANCTSPTTSSLNSQTNSIQNQSNFSPNETLLYQTSTPDMRHQLTVGGDQIENDKHESDSESQSDDESASIAGASMWTRKDIQSFKESIKTEGGDGIIKVGHGEIVTVRVPTHEDGTCLFWEFATDSYDIGFGLLFEWTKNPGNQVSVHISESEDETEEDEEAETTVSGDVEKGSSPDQPPNPSSPISNQTDQTPVNIIIPIYRRDCHEEVYAGSHVYPGKGVYLLKFDNSYSLWRSKTLYYRVYYTR